MWARGNIEQIADEGCEPSLLLYIRHKKYAVLPLAGGLLDQDPDLMDDFDFIEAEVAKHGR